MCRQSCLTVRSQAPFGLSFADATADVRAGEIIEAKLSVRRWWPEFTEKIQLTVTPVRKE
jgi:hypothetical protein